MKNIFTPEDFGYKQNEDEFFGNVKSHIASDIANAKLNKLINSWPIIFNDSKIGEPHGWYSTFSQNPDKKTVLKARLAFVESIPKEPCKHEPKIREYRAVKEGNYLIDLPLRSHCKNCGVELEATWNEIKK